MELKNGVKLNGMKPEILLAIFTANRIWLNHAKVLVVTEITGGKHGTGSLHYAGLAVDLRTKYFESEDEKSEVAQELRQALGENYDVVLEPTHIHVEFQPK